MSPIRIGLVGIGSAGTQHARALKLVPEDAVLAALCAPSLPRCAEFEQQLNLRPVPHFARLEDLLASGTCDAVILATPDGAHHQQTIEALGSRHHVLVEKPMALCAAEGDASMRIAVESTLVLEVGYHLRHHAGHKNVRNLMPRLVGRPRSIFIRWAWKDPAEAGWRAQGRSGHFWSMAALGTHCADLAMWFAYETSEPRVAGLLTNRDSRDSAAEVTLAFPGGVTAHLSVSVEYHALSRIHIVGDEGEIECLSTLGAKGEGYIWYGDTRGHRQPVEFVPQNPYAAQLRHFVSRIRSESWGWGAARHHDNLRILDELRKQNAMPECAQLDPGELPL